MSTDQRVLGAILAVMMLAGVVAMWPLLKLDAANSYEARVVSGVERCEYSWSWGRRSGTSVVGDCSAQPAAPSRVPAGTVAHVYRGQELSVEFVDAKGQNVAGKLFLRSPQADDALRIGWTRVAYDPEKSNPTRKPIPAMFMILMMVLAPVMGGLLGLLFRGKLNST